MIATDPTVVAHVSDLHLGAHCERLADELPADLAAARPTVTVVTGDLTMRARPDQFRRARALLDRLPEPQLVVTGNHDLPLGNLARRLGTPYARYRSHILAELDPVLDLPRVRVLGLASTPRWRWKSGRVSGRQAALVTEALGGASPSAVRVLALHHPPFRRGLARLAGRDRLVRSLVHGRVELVLCGHTHLPTSQRLLLPAYPGWHPVVEVNAGTATSHRTRGAGCSWTLIRVDSELITVEERSYLGAGWRASRTTHFPRAG